MKQIIRLNFLDAISKAKHGVTFDKLNERNPKIGTKLLLLADKIIK